MFPCSCQAKDRGELGRSVDTAARAEVGGNNRRQKSHYFTGEHKVARSVNGIQQSFPLAKTSVRELRVCCSRGEKDGKGDLL